MAAEAVDLDAGHDPALTKLSKKDNPYSFKKFVSKKSSNDVNVELRSGKKKKQTKKVSTDLPFPDLADEDSTTKALKSEENGDNPFSFKSFLTQKEAKETLHQPPTVLTKEKMPTSSSSSAESDDLNSPTVLHPSRQTSGEALLARVGPVALHSSSSESSFEDDDDDDDDVDDKSDLEAGPPHPLLSQMAEIDGEEVERLRADNEELKRSVAEYKGQLRKETHKCKTLEHKMKSLKKKEKEESMALEAVVRKAEKNLKLTTERAILAESKAAKLQKTVQSLQDQLSQLRGKATGGVEDQLLQQVKERTSYTAQQMDMAANKAEVTLKDLLAGVDTLRHLSQVLSSIDKITECTETPTP